jgi:hypothetical protein
MVVGRGTVVMLDDAHGLTTVVGDIVELVHAGSAVRTRCAGVEMGSRRIDGSSVPFIGLLLPGVRPFDVAPGDHLRVGLPLIEPDDLRIDLIRVAGGRPDAIRVTHLPTGTTVTVDDQPSAQENHERALERLLERLRA